MSNQVYPTLPGLTFGVVRAPLWKTQVDETASGREFRQRKMIYPRYRYVLKYEFLRNTASMAEMKTLAGFFNTHGGGFDSFLFTDPDDNSVTDQVLGVGDGAKTQFQLSREFGGFVEPVYDKNVITNVKKGAAVQADPADYTVNSTGLITFAVAPLSGVNVTWTGTFYWRVRFSDDTLDFQKFMQQFWELGKVELKTNKP